MTNEEIQKHIEQNCRYPDGTPAMDEQAFYEGAKWMRDQALRIHDVVGQLVCGCGNKLTDKELYFGQCLQCDKNIEE
jgi:hypothetical protein